MSSTRDFELEISEQTAQNVAAYAQKTNQTEEEVIEYVLKNFLVNQIPMLEKRSEELDKPMSTLVNNQFARIVDYLNSQA